MKKVILLSVVFLLLITGCKTTYNLQDSKNAHDQILEAIHSKKIVFIGETHTTVFPILYMTQNIEKFYEAGVRYLFLEEEGDGFSFTDGNYDNYKICIVPQWCTYAWKYEYHLMEKEIARINQLHPEDPINVIFPENGVVLPEDMNDGVAVLNARDEQAHKSIIEIMDAAKPEDKAIIFYGDGHGSKVPDNYWDYEGLWYPSGYYLNKYYGDQYAAFDIWYLRNDDYTKVKYGRDSNFKVLDEKYLSEKQSSAFDYFCVTDQRIYGITYPYITTDENIKVVYDIVRNFTNDKTDPFYDFNVIEFGFAISFLKYYFGDLFPFSFEKNNLEEALNILEEKVFRGRQPPSSFCVDLPAFTMTEWEKYAEYMFSYMWLENYLLNNIDTEKMQKKAAGYVIYNMNHAVKMNPHDIWPKYWLAYFKTEKAKLINKKSAFQAAISEWENFFNEDAAYTCPALLQAYRRIAYCYSELGDKAQEQLYFEKAKKLAGIFPFDSMNEYYFGY